jgi:RNA polymerase sigma factor (sigma-70 family)
MQGESPELIVRHLRQRAWAKELADQADGQLVQRFAAHREEAAFAALVSRHGRMVLGVCRRVLRDAHAAEDVFQAAFLILARKAGSIRQRESVGAWLYGVAYRLAVRASVRAAHRHQREQRSAARAPANPLEDASWREVGAILDQELNRLPARYRACLVICCLEGKTRDEAAIELGLPLRTLQRHLERGRKLLRARLARRGVVFAVALSTATLSQQLAAAAVPAALADAAINVAQTAPSAGPVAALAEEFLHNLRWETWKVTGIILLAAAAAVLGFVWASETLMPMVPDAVPTPVPERVPAAAMTKARAPLVQPAQDAAEPLRHNGPVNCVAISADGNTIASGSEGADTTLRLWQARTGRQIYCIDVKCGVLALAFSSDGKLAVGCDDKTVRLFKAADGTELGVCRGHGDTAAGKEHFFAGQDYRGVSSLVFTDDGKTLITGGYDGTVRLWDVAGGRAVCRFDVPGHKVHRLALSADGKTLAAGCEDLGVAGGYHAVRLWDVTTRQAIRPDTRRFQGIYSNGPVTALAFAPNGKHLAVAGFDAEVTLWDVATPKVVRSFRKGPLMVVKSLAFAPDGSTVAAGSSDARIAIWDAATARPLRLLAAHPGPVPARLSGVSSLVFAPDSKTLVSGGADQRVCLWEVASGKERAWDN